MIEPITRREALRIAALLSAAGCARTSILADPQPTKPDVPRLQFARRYGDRPAFGLLGAIHDILIRGDEAGGLFALMEVLVPPDNGPPSHVHSREDETFVVLEGEVTVWFEEKTLLGKPGSTIYAPRGIPHRYRNTGSTPSRILVWYSPAGFENFFREAGEPWTGNLGDFPVMNPAQMAKVVQVLPKYGAELKLGS